MEVEISAPARVRWHLDDKNWPSADPAGKKAKVRVRCLPSAAIFVAAPKARAAVDR